MENAIRAIEKILAGMISGYIIHVIIETFMPYWRSFGSPVFELMVILFVIIIIADQIIGMEK